MINSLDILPVVCLCCGGPKKFHLFHASNNNNDNNKVRLYGAFCYKGQSSKSNGKLMKKKIHLDLAWLGSVSEKLNS